MDFSTVNWAQVAAIVITNLAGILTAAAILIAVIKGNFAVLKEAVDGSLDKMIEAVKDSKKVEGKVDALIQSQSPTVIKDRRKD